MSRAMAADYLTACFFWASSYEYPRLYHQIKYGVNGFWRSITQRRALKGRRLVICIREAHPAVYPSHSLQSRINESIALFNLGYTVEAPCTKYCYT